MTTTMITNDHVKKWPLTSRNEIWAQDVGVQLQCELQRVGRAEQTWLAGSALRWFTCPKVITHRGNSQAHV